MLLKARLIGIRPHHIREAEDKIPRGEFVNGTANFLDRARYVGSEDVGEVLDDVEAPVSTVRIVRQDFTALLEWAAARSCRQRAHASSQAP